MSGIEGMVGRGSTAAWLIAALLAGLPGAQMTNAQTASGQTDELFAAAMSGDTAKIETLLASGVAVDVRDPLGQTALITAALAGQDGVAGLLVDKGADIKARTDKGMTALHAAAFSGDLAVLQLLLSHGAAVNDQDNFAHITALHAAAEENHVDVVKTLIKSGADPALVDVKGYSASTLAGWKQNWDAVQFMVKNGDICQPEAIAGPWVYKKCTALAS